MRKRLRLFVIGWIAGSLSIQGQDARMAKHKAHRRPSPNVEARTAAGKPNALVPLTERERAVQILDRFTFGGRPGDVDRVLAMGAGNWFEQQLRPETIKDTVVEKRLAEYPTLTMTPEQALATYPDRGTIQRVADGKQPMPPDPLLASVYEVQVARLRAQMASGKAGPMQTSDAEIADEKQEGRITADRIAGQLLAMPRGQRMAALLTMPVDDRTAFATYLNGEQRNILFAEFSPREREALLAMGANVGAQYLIGQELAQAKMVRAILSERQLQEVMSDFWFNHFNVYIGKDSDQWYTTSYERDVIRKYALGKFADLLLATAQSPAMLVYLDNWLSIGPDSLANGVNPRNPKSKPGNRGLNENYGREVMELHTSGVNSGYSQADVTNLSAILTGWTVDRPYQAGGFQYDARRHEPGTKTWLGHRIGAGAPFVIQGASAEQTAAATKAAAPMEDEMMMGENAGAGKAVAMANSPGNDGMKEGLEALNLLAHSPATAHFISREIAQRFVADDPPETLVDAMAKTFLASDGDIRQVLRTLAGSPEFNSKKYFRNKVKTPMEFLASAYRTTLTEPTNPGALVNAMRTMGMPLYQALPPTGYYITADKWMNTSALVDRLNFAQQLTSGKFAGQKFDAAKVVALGLISEPLVTEPAAKTTDAAVLSGGPKLTEATLRNSSVSASEASAPSGTELALGVLESTMIGGQVSSNTSELIHKQLSDAEQQRTPPAEMLNRLTALVMGSPEFQLR